MNEPNGSVILSPQAIGNVETTGRHANKATEERLTEYFRHCWQRDPSDGSTVTLGRRRSYIFQAGHWLPIKPEPPEAKPEHGAAILMLYDHQFANGDRFLLFRFPTAANWHKKIVPALGRLVRKLTGKAMKHGRNCDIGPLGGAGDPAIEFGQLQYPVKFDYVDGEFIELSPGLPRPPEPDDAP
jgi:hypothetical protein